MIKSPCVGVCKISDLIKVCEGCFRTRREIARWPDMDNNERIETIQLTELRALMILKPQLNYFGD